MQRIGNQAWRRKRVALISAARAGRIKQYAAWRDKRRVIAAWRNNVMSNGNVFDRVSCSAAGAAAAHAHLLSP